MRTTPTSTYDPSDLITSAWVITNNGLIDINTHVLSPLMNTSVGALKPNIVTTQLEANATIEAANKYCNQQMLYMVVMDLDEAEALMRFNATMSLKILSAKSDTLIDTATSLNFVSKEFVMANGFYKDCKNTLNLAIRVTT